MKKLLMSALILITVFASVISASEQLTGGWTVSTDSTISSEVQEVFKKATESYDDGIYTPVALLATQVVAGTNYCLLCREAGSTNNAPDRYVLMYVYADLQGGAKVLEVSDIPIGVSSVPDEADSIDAVTFENFPDKIAALGIDAEKVWVAADMIGAVDGFKLEAGTSTVSNGGSTMSSPIACEVYRFDPNSEVYQTLETTGMIEFMGFPIEMETCNGYGLIISDDFPEYEKVIDLFGQIQ